MLSYTSNVVARAVAHPFNKHVSHSEYLLSLKVHQGLRPLNGLVVHTGIYYSACNIEFKYLFVVLLK